MNINKKKKFFISRKTYGYIILVKPVDLPTKIDASQANEEARD